MFCSRNEEPNTSHQLANCQVKIDLTPDTPDTPDTLTHITVVYLVTRSGRLPAWWWSVYNLLALKSSYSLVIGAVRACYRSLFMIIVQF